MNVTLSSLRSVRWGKSYLWDIQFPAGPSFAGGYAYPPDPPILFQDWFPAHNVQEPVFSVNSFGISLPVFDFQIPKGISSGSLTISFYDDIFENLREWLWSWVMWMFTADPNPKTGIFGQGGTAVRTLAECVRPVIISRYTERNDQNPSMVRQYYVYPSDTMISNLTSESAPVDYTVNFVVVSGMFTVNLPNLEL